MTVSEMKRRKREKGYSYAQIAELSGVPLGTVQKVFSGETASPRYETLRALERLLGDGTVREEPVYRAYAREHRADGEGCGEPIDGRFDEMFSLTFLHQRIVGELYRQIANFLIEKRCGDSPFLFPVGVRLDGDGETVVYPDIGILCDPDKIGKQGVCGAPDFVAEVVSPATKRLDYTRKLSQYMEAGVREYWIVDPDQKKLLAYFLERDVCPAVYCLDGTVAVGLYGGKLKLDFAGISRWIDEDREQEQRL